MSDRTYIHTPEFKLKSEKLYDVISEYIFEEHPRKPIVIKGDMIGADMEVLREDCFVDATGNLFVPTSYSLIYKGTNDTDDTDEYDPNYSEVPTLTSEEVEAKLVQYLKDESTE